ncbi:MAG: heavy-metal-associated domain-containing protein [Planctomycetota bacterium]|nr:heavy-metal-associated domain-containing protein [Planctomycetota bacterium]
MKISSSLMIACLTLGFLSLSGCGVDVQSEVAQSIPAAVANEETGPTPYTPQLSENGECQLVSLMLPNMCCDGCVASIQEELAKVEGISEFEADAETHIATFEANKDLDVGNLLDDLSKTNSHIEGWSQNEEEAVTAAAETEGEGSDSAAS